MKKLYLDDIRSPKTEDWIIVRDYDEFKNFVETNGLPDLISFDHDLGEENGIEKKTGYDVAKWICEYCWSNGLPLPSWNVHSANPVGRDNIIQLLQNFEKKLSSF